MKAIFVAVAMLFCGAAAALAQGYPTAAAINDSTMFFVCQPGSGGAAPVCTGGPASEMLATASALVTYLQSKLPAAGAVNVIFLSGSDTGVFVAPGITAANKILLCQSANDDLSSSTFNFSPTGFVVVGSSVNPTAGLQTAAGQIIDPTATHWASQGLNLICLYE